MARPRKPINYEEELIRIESQITKYENTLKELKEERRLLCQQKEQDEISKLYDVYKASGMSLEEMIAMVSQKEA
ncbi:MAG: hypothetical protein HFG18_04225 [Oscillospiraceae bacterium]|nr:hypothetical protein [Oscillospiraceae bacterium]MCI9363741.1 hypothetical protein [Oscillospiraceae bacterium]